jgi:hypothetical protein
VQIDLEMLAQEPQRQGCRAGDASGGGEYKGTVGDRELALSSALALFNGGALQWHVPRQPQSPACVIDVRGCLQCSNLVLPQDTCIGVSQQQGMAGRGQGANFGLFTESSLRVELGALSAKPGVMHILHVLDI